GPRLVQPMVLAAYPGLAHVVQVRIDVLMEKGGLNEARTLAFRYGLVGGSPGACIHLSQTSEDLTSDEVFRSLRAAVLSDPTRGDCLLGYGQWLSDEGYVRLARVMLAESAKVMPSVTA